MTKRVEGIGMLRQETSPPAAGNARGPRGLVWLFIALIVVVVVVAYSNSLRSPFVFDDLAGIASNQSIRQMWPLRNIFLAGAAGEGGLHSRPVVNLTWAINYAMGGLDTLPYHLTNLAIHLLAAVTLFGIVRRTLALPRIPDRLRHKALPLALTVALIWALHPLQTQAVTYLTQRFESLMGLFYLAALYSLIRAGTSGQRRTWAGACVTATLLALGSKEVAVSLPIVLLLYDRAFLAGSLRAAWAQRRGLYLGLLGAWLGFMLLQALSASRSNWAGYRLSWSWQQYALSQFGVVLHYLQLSLWPQPLVLDYGWAPARTAGQIVPGVMAVGGLALASAFALFHWPRLGWLGAWFFLILAPTSSVLPLADLIFLHRMYLPLAAVVVVVVLGGHIVTDALERRRWLTGWRGMTVRVGLVAAVAATLAAATLARNGDFASALSIWTDTVTKAPHNARAHNYLGTVLVSLGRTDEAITQYRQALKDKSDYAEAHSNLGLALVGLGRNDEAIAHYRMALKIKPDSAEVHNNLGIALVGLGRTDEAITQYRQALENKSDYAEARTNLGNLLANLGRTDEAIALYEQALKVAVQQKNKALADYLLKVLARHKSGTPARL